MAINIKFDLAGNPEPPTIILTNRNGNRLGQLYVDKKSIDVKDCFNDASEFSFILNKYVNGELTPLWDKVLDFKLVYCKEWDMFFEIKVELDEATKTVKTVFCTQLGQAELSQIVLYDVEINTEDDIARDDYKISILYDENDQKSSILDRLLEKAPHYRIAYVDPTIAKIQRSFSFDGTSILDAHQEIAEEIGCLFIYPSNSGDGIKINRDIFVYDLQQNCNECGHRGEFTGECPKCGSKNIKYGYGKDTTIFVTADELASSGIKLVTDTESVKNCFKLEAGDDLMTATVRNCNPNGSDYIWHFSDALKEDMPNELVEKLNSYEQLSKYYQDEHISNLGANLLKYNAIATKYYTYNKNLKPIKSEIVGYSNLMNAYYDVTDMLLFLQSGLMPSVEMSDTTAEEQVRLLNSSSLSPVAVADVTIASLSTINSAVLAMAKTIVRPTYKIQIDKSEIVNEGNSKIWKGNFIVENYSDEEDVFIGDTVSVSVDDDLESFVKQKIDKILNKENTDDLSISGLFEKDYDDFCSELKKYALNPLVSFRDACQSCIDILIEQGVASENNSNSDLYENLYQPYYNKLIAIESEIAVRESEIADIYGTYDSEGNLISDGLMTDIERCRNEIQTALNFKDYLGDELWLEFCSYRREDSYSNDNYISDGLNNAELFKRALEFFETAKNEIYKSSELQHSISTTLNNLLAIPKFKSFVENFDVGNWIRVKVDDKIYKLRLLEYEIDFGDFNNISVEFSDVTKIKSSADDIESVLSQASSMASSYDYIKRQATKGNEAKNTVNDWIANGLSAALIQIQSSDSEDITFTKNGLLGRSYDEITGTYSPEQVKLTHNIIAYTDDNWQTIRQAIGKHKYNVYSESENSFVEKTGYGLSADFVVAGIVSGSQIVGGDIYSDNYSVTERTGSYLNLRDGTFSFGGGALRFEGGSLIISSPDIPTTEDIQLINEEYLKTATVYAENLKVNSTNINGKLTASQIDATELTVNAANITGSLSAQDIGVVGAFTAYKDDNTNGGKIGYMSGLSGDSGSQTNGIGMSNVNGDAYIIATDAGIRCQVGDKSFYMTISGGKFVLVGDLEVYGNISYTGELTQKTAQELSE